MKTGENIKFSEYAKDKDVIFFGDTLWPLVQLHRASKFTKTHRLPDKESILIRIDEQNKCTYYDYPKGSSFIKKELACLGDFSKEYVGRFIVFNVNVLKKMKAGYDILLDLSSEKILILKVTSYKEGTCFEIIDAFGLTCESGEFSESTTHAQYESKNGDFLVKNIDDFEIDNTSRFHNSGVQIRLDAGQLIKEKSFVFEGKLYKLGTYITKAITALDDDEDVKFFVFEEKTEPLGMLPYIYLSAPSFKYAIKCEIEDYQS